MTILTFNFHNEQEEKVLLAFLDSLQYDYQREDQQQAYELSEEEVQSLLKTKQDFLAGSTTARNWEDIKREIRRA